MQEEQIRGYIERVTFRDPEDGYTVMTVMTDKGEVSCVGTAKGYAAGETVALTGHYEEHRVYGKQLRFQSIQAVAPVDNVSLMRYLCSGAVKGIGEKRAVKIIDTFGEDTYRVLEEEPERLVEVKGISERAAREIAAQLMEKRDQRRTMMHMQQYGISPALCEKLYEMYHEEIYGILKNNPYRLADEVPAVGFKTADAIARKAGIARGSEYRIRAALQYELGRTSQDGHCYFPADTLCWRTAQLLVEGAEADGGQYDGELPRLIAEQLVPLAADHRLVLMDSEGGQRVYQSIFYREEVYSARRLMELRDAYEPTDALDDEVMRGIADAQGMQLDASQAQAVREALGSGVFLLSGGPGTGKTTTINVIIGCLERLGRSFALAAPTGRAAKRMTEATGHEAQTVHRLLEMAPSDAGAEGAGRSGFFYGRSEEEPLEVDTLIVDEVSMVDIHLLRALLAALPEGAQLILVGDVDQLPSVGPGQVLRDLMESGVFACVRLQVVHRQSGESHIVTYAHQINQGVMPDLTLKHRDFFLLEMDAVERIHQGVCELLQDILPRKKGLALSQMQVLTPMRRGPLGVEGLNAMLQERLNPSRPGKAEAEHGDNVYRVGDKVMQIRNDYQREWEIPGAHATTLEEGTGIYNGDTGVVAAIDSYLKYVTVAFDDGKVSRYDYQDLDALDLAYAVTIHKSQGSEYPVVLLPLLSGPPMLMTRNLLYTAVTRAKDCVIVLGSREAFRQMVARDHVQSRYTSLCEFLSHTTGARYR